VHDKAQLRCIVNARRHDIVDQLAARGPMSVRELAAAIHARPSALYYHLRVLVRVGLVVEDGHRVVRRKREVLYACPAPRMRFKRALHDPRHAPTFVRIAASMSRQMQRDFRRGILSPGGVTDGGRRNLGLFRLVGSPDAKTLRQINRRLDEVAELLWQSAGTSGDVISLAWVMAPLAPGAGKGKSAK
jgi:DNA-binding transcriptional ArsR family regulator